MKTCGRKFVFLILVGNYFLAARIQGADTSHSSDSRPFYLIGHGANTPRLAAEYLAAGANGLEIDVNQLAGHTNVLCVGHGPDVGSGPAQKHHSVPLAVYLQGLHALARTNAHFCLVYFDCKTLVATPELGSQLLNSIRADLAGTGADRVDLIALISVGKLREKAMFANITHQLGPREALMVDGYSDPDAVSGFFTQAGVTNQAFSDGIVPLDPILSLFEVYRSVSHACLLKRREQHIRFVGTWVVNNPWLMTRYIHMGVDGIVVDRHFTWYNFCWANWGNGLSSLVKLVRQRGEILHIHAAERADNPFAKQPGA